MTTMNKKSLPARLKQLHIHCSQGYSGTLTRESQIIFNYETDNPDCEISLTTPLTRHSYAGNILPGVLRQNLPEGYLLNWMHERFGKTMKMDDFNILALTGRDMIGRVRCSLDAQDSAIHPEPESLSKLLSWSGTEDLFAHLAEKYATGSGISGVQPKVLVAAHQDAEVVLKAAIKDRHLIVKAGGADYPDLPENEYHCMQIGKLAGLDVPRFWLSENREVFIVERFDIDSEGQYLGFEDMTALTGRQNQEKYQGSYEIAASVIDTFSSPQHKTASLAGLFQSIVLSVAVRNGDAHLKNFGLLYSTPRSDDIRLSPLYDIVNTTSYLPRDVMALKMAKEKSWPDRERLIEFGKRHCKLDRPQDAIDRITEAAQAYRPGIEPGPIWQAVRMEIEKGCRSISSAQVHVVSGSSRRMEALRSK